MIARLAPSSAQEATYDAFLNALQAAGFRGEIARDLGDRTVLATDNSIYQRLPQAAVFPLDVQDVQLLSRLAGQAEHSQVVLTPRGGGTGTNGQSLTDGVVVDLSRHLNGILEINVEERWVRVQSGVVKDQLNAALKPHGLFFAPELSTSNRATVGGMINTDASGQGSCTYGKTRDHVLELSTVLVGGAYFTSSPMDGAQLSALAGRGDRVAQVYQCALDIVATQAELIETTFPKLNRCLTGYDLAHLREADGRFNLNSVLCGSEGSLGFIVEAKLNVLPIPRHSILVNVRYAGFMDALRDAKALMAMKPLSIETVDSKVLMLAMNDIVWHGVAEYFPEDPARPTLGINLIEFSADDEEALQQRVHEFVQHLQRDTSVVRLGHTLAIGADALKRVYAMRKRAVGLLGNVKGEARPQPFVEDTAVPPENLADFILEFRALLDSHGLQYGMFGHVDAGVLHVRPILDMKDPAQAALVRPVSDAVAALTQKYGGLLWGEHGKGLRSQYVPDYFGDLYPALQALKAAFDPNNQLNPGKIATPATVPGARLTRVDEVTLRGELDRTIDERVWKSYDAAVHCNGNGACYNFDPDDAMCPSWKATRNRVHSPKGRASLIREWLRRQGLEGVDVLAASDRLRAAAPWSMARRAINSLAQKMGQRDFSHEVYEAMAGCLACKSCAGQCPVKVNVPEFRSRFLELYHSRYLRPLKDYLIGSLEYTVPHIARMPRLYNFVMGARPVRWVLERAAGMVDSPLLSLVDFTAACRTWGVEAATPERLAALSDEQREKSVILVQDAFTRFFETPLLVDWLELIARLGYKVYLAPYAPNGKPLQVQGFLKAFEKAANFNGQTLSSLQHYRIPLVGLDPAMTLVYRQEYTKAAGDVAPRVLLAQEWLASVMPHTQVTQTDEPYQFLPHCTEKTNEPGSVALWQKIFERMGLTLQVPASGCCGMSGTYGHEARNATTSDTIYGQSWKPLIKRLNRTGRVVADGYSCRSQIKRQEGTTVLHPLQVVLARVREQAGADR
ncbi:FAD/FMN-containing dehydrogenase [Pseudomonas sp. NFACC32-1]|uniref:D-2-hydroxyglutarate dehydrogenase YdiJ n=1 Tax=unclassified Pseudomonas TaxID=196821 RepID=UPI000876AE13|nr:MULTISPECIES: FAD-binding and (Fe-S)-binding domain-containing protein [unclassified Pseudomonas]MDB6443720.1 FAD-binding and (Fe-S)-binding domain-containing protein [Pseudomonas sp. 21TX0197]SCX44748.1 FAD/FMN-containing dehydrogenase [Pseudomonas sp. NFACC32-1]